MQSGDRSRGPGSLLVVKLGGSIITYKDRAFTPRIKAIHRIASELSVIHREHGLGIVIGGGSYGHYSAHIQSENSTGPADSLYTVSMAMAELAQLVADVLGLHGVPTMIFPPHAICDPRGLRPNCYWRQVVNALQKGVAPLLYGDIYPCDNSLQGWCIVSGDEIAMEMACTLGAEKVIYATDVDGVLDTSGRLVRELRLGMLPLARGLGATGQRVDVTGGLQRKLEAIKENWCSSLKEVWIVNGLEEGNIIAVIKGVGHGTVIKP